MNKLLSTIKPYLRWFIVGATLFFLAKALKDHVAEVAAIRIDQTGGGILAIALLISLIAYTWSAAVYFWILKSFQQPVNLGWTLSIYLKTNLAKYLPGNLWHYYGRIIAIKNIGGSTSAATVSIVLEFLLMMAAALIIAISGIQHKNLLLQLIILVIVLLVINPKFLNPAIQVLQNFKDKAKGAIPSESSSFTIAKYPLLALCGEIIFLLLRGTGFILTFLAITNLSWEQLPLLFSTFSISWLIGVSVPGAPGGIGVFEATAIAFLAGHFPMGQIISVVAIYRLISLLSEVIAAGLAVLSDRQLLKV